MNAAKRHRTAQVGNTTELISETEPTAGTSCGTCPLLRRTLYGILDPCEIETLQADPPVRIVRPKTIIHRQGHAPDEVYSVRSGWAFRFILLPDGRRQILSLYLPGDLISVQALRGKPLWFSVQALSPMTLCVFDRAALRARISRHEKLLQRMEDLCVLHTARMDSRLVDIGRRRAIERVALLILEVERRFAVLGECRETGSFPFLLRQEHVADMLGLTRVHVSRTFGQLRRQKIVTASEGRLSIEDRPQLLKLAGLPDHADGPEPDIFAA